MMIVTYQIKLIGAKGKLRKKVSINKKVPLSQLLMALFCQSLRGKGVHCTEHVHIVNEQRQKINRPRDTQSLVFSYTYSLPFATSWNLNV